MIDKLLEERKLPDILIHNDGKKVTPETWEQRRKEILDLLAHEEYGIAPPLTDEIKTEIIKENKDAFAGKAIHKINKMTLKTDSGEFSFEFTEVFPKDLKNVPVFILLNFHPDVPDRYCPTEEIIDSGCAVLQIYYNDISLDEDDNFSSGLATHYDRKKYNWSKLRMWAYAASSVLTYALSTEYTDKTRTAVVGHSRLGKTALIASAFDTRFALCCANDSGCSGDAITRRKKGERVYDIYSRFPYWFCEEYNKYSNNEDAMPFDQHFLVAASAPRKVCIGAAVEDEWADPISQYLSACAASCAWELLGKKGFIHEDKLPEAGTNYPDGDIKYHLRSGKHYLSRTDWAFYIDAIKNL